MCIWIKLFIYLYNFDPEKSPLDVVLLLLLLNVVSLHIGDGLQPSRQGLYKVHQVPPPLRSCPKSYFIDKVADTYLRPQNFALFAKFFERASMV
jgi:hypothetical protein